MPIRVMVKCLFYFSGHFMFEYLEDIWYLKVSEGFMKYNDALKQYSHKWSSTVALCGNIIKDDIQAIDYYSPYL